MKKNQTNRKRVISLSLVVLLTVSGFSLAAQPTENVPVLIFLEESVEINAVVEAVYELNGTVSHIFSPQVIIGSLTGEAEEQLLQNSGITVYRGPVDSEEYDTWSKDAKYAAIAWNNNYMGLSVDAGLNEPPVSPEPPPDDTEITPECADIPGELLPSGAGFLDTSEYLVGSVAVSVLLLESNGIIDEDMENWTEEEEAHVVSEVQNGLNWLANQESEADITFVYEWHFGVPVGYEPVTRPHTDDDLWEQQALFYLGYTSNDYLLNEYQYVNDLREKYNTDWGFIIFVVDSSEDEDNAFNDGYYAYSFLGGPRMVVTYSNSIWGIANLDSIVAHETCHIFWALDQHCNSQINKDAVSGYLAGENTNSEWNGESCTISVPCIMKGEPMFNSQIDVSTRKQLGWYDSDSDGILDVLDTNPGVTLSVDEETYTCTGTARVSPLANENPLKQKNAVSLNTIHTVEYRLDEGEWTQAECADANYDEPEEAFLVTCDIPDGEHTITVRAQNNVGNWSDPYSVTVVKEEPQPVGEACLSAEISLSPDAVNADDTVLVTMAVQNTGEVDVQDVVPSLTAPDTVEIASGPTPESADISSGDAVTFEWVYTVKTTEGELAFSGSAKGTTEAGDEVTAEAPDSNVVVVHIEPVLTSDITALLFGVIEGNTITLTLEVRNTGETTLENVTPSEVTVTCTGTASADLLLGPLPQPPVTLEPGTMKKFEWKYTTTSGSQGGTAVFTASVSGEADGAPITSDLGVATVGIESPALLTTFIVATPREVTVGDIITVAMTVQNIGQAEAVEVVPSELSVSGTGDATLEEGPSRTSVKIKGHSFEIILWTYIATKEGTVTFSGNAQGIDSATGNVVSIPQKESNSVTIAKSNGNTQGSDQDDSDTDTGDSDTGTDADTGDADDSQEIPPTPPPTPAPTPPPEQTNCSNVTKTIQKVRALLQKAKDLLEQREKENRDVRICSKILYEAEMFLRQAELHLQKGECEQAQNRAITAMLKVYEVLNCLENM